MSMKRVKLRTYLLLANALSLATILVLLFFSYSRMLLDATTFIWLSCATLAAGLLSFVLHYVLIRPLERSLNRIGEASKEIASGSMGVEVPIVGTAEFRQLAERFNGMSRQLGESFSRLRQAEGSRRELVANVAHDLRTPLALLQSHAEALQDGLIQDHEVFRQYLNTIRSESVRLGSLVQDLFELSRIDAGTQVYDPEPIDLEDVLVATLNAFAPRLEAKRLDARVSLPEPSPIVLAMDSGLRRIVGNLLDNAIRHSPEGGVIRITAANSNERFLIVRVQNEGPSIPAEERERIFERFYRVDPARRRDGSGGGLGLAIAKSLVEMQGGSIGLEPTGLSDSDNAMDAGNPANPRALAELSSGSLFWFTVPLAEAGYSEGRGS